MVAAKTDCSGELFEIPGRGRQPKAQAITLCAPQNHLPIHQIFALIRKLFSFLLALLAFTAQAQVTFKITAVPANTPANTTIYLAGSFNNWNPGSAAHALTYDATDRSYQITLPAGTGTPNGSGGVSFRPATRGSTLRLWLRRPVRTSASR